MVGWLAWNLPLPLGVPVPRDQFSKVLFPIIV